MIIPLITLTSLLFGTVTAACSSNRTCLEIYVSDAFHDGWDGAEVFVETPWGDVFSTAPTCDADPKIETLCTDMSGNYPMVLTHEDDSYTPKNHWEAFWKVSVKDCNSTKEFYTGGYNTTMIWSYDADSDEWTLVYYENLWPNTKECDACGDATGCKPKPPPKKKHDDKKKRKDDNRKNSKDDHKHKHGKDDQPIDSGETNTTVVPKEKPRYGPPAVNLRITMWDEEGDGWWKNDYSGNSWYLADDTRTELFFTGTLCDGNSGYCNLCLGDGSYTIRFTGNVTDDFVSWDFCGVRGEYAQELSFHVKKGECIPDSLVNLNQICANTVSSTVTLSGVLALAGFSSEVFNVADTSIVSRVLGEFVTGWSETLNVVSTSLDTRSMTLSSRRLSEFTFDLAFEVSFLAEKVYGVDGRDFAAVKELVSTLGDNLSNRVASSNFVSLLHSAATGTTNSHLTQVRAAELVSLNLDGISYEGTAIMERSNLPPAGTADWGSSSPSMTVSSYNYTTLSLFFGSLLVGFFAFIGILSHGMNGYTRISQNPFPEVMPSDMDDSVTRPLNCEMGNREGQLSLAEGRDL